MNTTQFSQSDKEVATANIVAAAHGFFIHSPRYCELKDKENAGCLHDPDEQQELRWLRVLSVNLNIYLA
jgi:hypothetical protein